MIYRLSPASEPVTSYHGSRDMKNKHVNGFLLSGDPVPHFSMNLFNLYVPYTYAMYCTEYAAAAAEVQTTRSLVRRRSCDVCGEKISHREKT